MTDQPKTLFENRPDSRKPDVDFAFTVVETPVAEEMSESFLAYSLSVITSRAIPDVRDGLKPVQRRILYAMLNLGIRPDGPHRKSARVVGDTMGKYHPHGDSAIYDALVRLAQDFSRPIPLIDSHGNFGTLDDPPAASRYTECRLAETAMEMLDEIDEDTVGLRPTYDGDGFEPECLPGRLPNLLVNGSTGIAVGMATNLACHNLVEVADAIELVMKKRRPQPSVEELMAVLPGPDFPSGGVVIDNNEGGLRQAYATGRGSIRIRAQMNNERLTRSRWGINVTELPYMVGPEKVVKRINDLIVENRLPGAHDARNLSDRNHGVRILIECKPNVKPESLYHDLYRLTPLEETFAINNVVLVDGVPTTVGLYHLCHYYIEHRLNVVVRRTRYRLGKARDRLHIVEGLIIALDNIDQVVAIIRGSDDVTIARQQLQDSLDLTEIQATHILDMQLRRLTALEKQKIIDEHNQLLNRIDQLEKLLNSEQRQRTVVLNELKELVTAYGQPRRTQILSADEAPVYESTPATEPTVASDEPCVVTLSTTGVVGRAMIGERRRSQLGRHDVLTASVTTTVEDSVTAVTSTGRALTIPIASVPEISGRSRGAPVSEVFGTSRGETVLTLFTPDADPLVMATAAGIVKRVNPADLGGGRAPKSLIKLKPQDKVVAAFCAPDTAEMVLVSSQGRVLRAPLESVSIQGRAAGGVIGLKLRAPDRVITAGCSMGNEVVIGVSADGVVSITAASEIPLTGRGGVGSSLAAGEKLSLAVVVPPADLLAEVDEGGRPAKTPVPLPMAGESEISTAVLGVGVARW